MSTIYTRATKGSALTWTEGDANITNLNNDKIEDIVEDTTPQLGGNLDVNGNSIVSASNGDIAITPNGTGSIVLDGQSWPQAAPATNGEYLTATSAGVITWTDRVSAKTIYENVKNVSGGSLAKGTPVYQVGVTGVATVTVAAARADDPAKVAIGVLDETIANEAEGTMTILGEIKGVNTSGFTVGDPVYLGATGGFTNVAPTSSSVAVQFLGIVFRVDASNGSGFITGTLTPEQVRYTGSAFELWDGDSWVAFSYISNLVEDTTPQLGGNLDVNGNSIVSASNGNITLAPNGTGKVVISGTLQVDGTTTTVNSTTVTIDDPIFTLGGDTAPASDDNKDRGIEFRWHNGTAAKVGFFGYDDSTGYLTFIPDATNTSEVFSGTQGDIQATNFRGALVGNADTATTLATTRAIYGNNFNGSAALTQVIASTYGGTGNGFAKFTGPTTSEKTFTLPNASSTIVVQGGALGTPSSGTVTNLTGTASININGTVGANTANTGAFTTLTANTSASLKAITEGALYDLGTTGGTQAPNVANGNVQKITLNSALTINAFTSPVAGQTLTLIIYGGTAYTSITSTMKFAGGIKTLTGTAGCIDILSVYYDGTNYFASLGKGFA